MHSNSREGDYRVRHELETFYYKPVFLTWSKGSEFENSGIN
jgi:hypothetical protein